VQERLESVLAPPPAVAAVPEPPLRILFSLLHAGYLRHYGRPIRLLAARGHEVHVALAQLEKDPADARLVEELAAECPTVTYGLAPVRAQEDGWRRIAWLVRALADVSRYAHPRYTGSSALRRRMADKLHWRIDFGRSPRPLKRLLHRAVDRLAFADDATLAEKMRRRLARLEDAIPTGRRIRRFVATQRPDVVLASPLIEFASTQVDYLKAARGLGIPTGVCVASWDNLTGKGLLRFVPDRVFVWNDIQRRELEEMHEIGPDRVVLTGAQRFDEWFDRKPSTTPAEFALKVGLDPGAPYVLYLCSSAFIAPNEVGFVLRWIDAIRLSGRPALERVGVLVRPHPQNGLQWQGVDLSRFGNAVLWPRVGTQPDAGEARADYFDSLAHSACIVGVNTSGLLEAGIVGKAVLTVLDGEFAGTQEGTLHFHYLRWENGGLLRVASELDEHLEQLERNLATGAAGSEQVTRFVERFCRPHGLDRPAAPLVAAGIEALARHSTAHRTRTPAGTLALRAALVPVATLLSVYGRAMSGARSLRRFQRRAMFGLRARVSRSVRQRGTSRSGSGH
jgi:hypothetical protein